MSIETPGEALCQGVPVVTSIAFETQISLPRLPHRRDGSKLDSSRMHKAEPSSKIAVGPAIPPGPEGAPSGLLSKLRMRKSEPRPPERPRHFHRAGAAPRAAWATYGPGAGPAGRPVLQE